MFIPGICIWPFTLLFDLCSALVSCNLSAREAADHRS